MPSNDDTNLPGTPNDDFLATGNGNDTINGFDGNDTLSPGLGVDSIDGGNGFDQLVYSNSTVLDIQMIKFNFLDGKDGGINDFSGNYLQFFEMQEFLITTGGGNDTLYGIYGNDTFSSSDGSDVINGDYGDDWIESGSGNDTVYGDGFASNAGNDTIQTGSGNDIIYASTTNTGFAGGTDSINGGDDSDRLFVYLGNSNQNIDYQYNIVGPQQFGSIQVESIESFSIVSGIGDDSISFHASGLDSDTISTGGGNDTLSLWTGYASVNLGTGEDVLNVNFQSLTTAVVMGSSNISNTSNGGLAFSGVEHFYVTTGSGDDSLVGQDFSDTFKGGAGNDTIEGGINTGADSIDGGAGNDHLYLGGGSDTLVASTGIDRVYDVSILEGDKIDVSRFHISNITELQNYITTHGGYAALQFDGLGENVLQFFNLLTSDLQNSDLYIFDTSTTHDTVSGGVGNDSLLGGLGNDFLFGDSGHDTVSGGQGADTITAWSGDDNVSGGEGNDSVNGGAGNDLVDGGEGNNVIAGDLGDDTLQGGSGNDTFKGGTGHDSMTGGVGNDQYYIDSIEDTVVELFDQGTDLIYTTISLNNHPDHENVENYVMIGTSDLSLVANGLNNSIVANSGGNQIEGLGGHDILDAKAGNDVLIGGLGNDTLTGGSGSDTFVYNNALEGRDRIRDFNAAEDSLFFSSSGFGGGLISSQALNSNQLVFGTAANAAQGQFIYNSVARVLWWDGDGTGSTAAVQIASFDVAVALGLSDFVIIG